MNNQQLFKQLESKHRGNSDQKSMEKNHPLKKTGELGWPLRFTWMDKPTNMPSHKLFTDNTQIQRLRLLALYPLEKSDKRAAEADIHFTCGKELPWW